MTGDSTVQDPLKPLDQVMMSDPRHRGSLYSLEKLHAELEKIRLHSGVSLHVRQLFETAKNLSLYSWHVCRFHPIAQLIGYASLERALRERLARERGVDVDTVRETFRPLMDLAATKEWRKNERFDAVRRTAHVQLKDEQTFRMLRFGEIGDEPVESPDIPEADILSRAAQLDYVVGIAESMPSVRNYIAHGGRILHGGSAATLRILAEAINQLFESKNPV